MTTTYDDKSYTVAGLSEKSPAQEKLTLKGVDGQAPRELTVLEYFQKEKKLRLKYPDLPLVDVSGLLVELAGSVQQFACVTELLCTFGTPALSLQSCE